MSRLALAPPRTLRPQQLERCVPAQRSWGTIALDNSILYDENLAVARVFFK